MPADATMIHEWAKEFNISQLEVIRRLYKDGGTQVRKGSFIKIKISETSELPITHFPSKSPLKLKELSITGCNIKSLDLTNLERLTYLDCSNNKLTDLDLSNASELAYLNCLGNNVATINLSHEALSCDLHIVEDLDKDFDEDFDEDSDEYFDEDLERIEIFTAYSVGSFGPFPVCFYIEGRPNDFYYEGAEYDSVGPFKSLSKAIDAAGYDDFGGTEGGFHLSLAEAEEHAEAMRQSGFGVE